MSTVNKCKKLGNRATKAERYEIHQAKMELKAALRGDFEEERPFVTANQSIYSENYGETPKEQTARMLKNNS